MPWKAKKSAKSGYDIVKPSGKVVGHSQTKKMAQASVRAYVVASSPAEAVRLAQRKSVPKEAWLEETALEARKKAAAEKLEQGGQMGFGAKTKKRR